MKPAPLALAAVLVAGMVLRRRTLSRERAILGALVAAALVVYGSGVVHPPDLEHTIRRIGSTLGAWTYLLVGAMAFLETGAFVGLIAPGEFTILLGGVVAGQGEISVVVLMAIVWASAVAGDATSFLLGRRLGRGFLERHGHRVKIDRGRLEQVERFFARYGGRTILIGRFVGLVRAVAPFIAGASRMPFRRFIPFDVVGAGIWGTGLVLLGYLFWQSFDRVVSIARQSALALSLVIGVAVGGYALWRHLRVPENRRRASATVARHADRPLVRPLARLVVVLWTRVLAPLGRLAAGPMRFLWHRLTPGELGLELTTLLAVALVGGFLFGATAALLSDPTVTTPDARAFDVVRHLRSGVVVDVAKVVTWLGSAPVMAVLVAATAARLLRQQRAVESAALLSGALLTYVAVHVAKVAEDRARPSGALVDTAGSSFPSGHAAYSIGLIAIAVVLVRVAPGFARRFGVVTLALVLAAAVGLTRVYLRAHHLSDVVAGWSLGAAAFAVCAIVALVVAFLRQNESR